ncbi:MAG: hypothetical protein KBD25_06255, partial [Rickettsiaceae bacterium]|nr:hypothetical protein [Rickettsiaceae bacterium]
MLKRILASFLIATGLLMPIAVQANVTKGPFSFTQGSFDFYYSIGGSMPTSQSLEFEHTISGGVSYA